MHMQQNPRSSRVRGVAKLAARRARSQTGLFLVEGPQSVREALDWRPELVEEVYFTTAAGERHPEILRKAKAAGVELEEATEEVLLALADTVTPQGFVAVARQPRAELSAVLAAAPRLIAVLHEVRDPGNAGTIIRAADAVAADAVIISGQSVDPFGPKTVRSTTGSLFHLPIVLAPELGDALAAVRAAGLTVLAADVKGDDLGAAHAAGVLAAPTAWLFGNEARGLVDDHLALADRALKLPIYGKAESLNLATAASVCLYQSAFAQRSALDGGAAG